MSTIYFCWVCGIIAPDIALAEPDPDDERVTHNFCSAVHRDEYRWLQAL